MNEREMHPKVVPVPDSAGPRSQSHTLVLIAAIALGIYLCYRLTMPFLSALVWALALAIVFSPFQRWLESKLKRRNQGKRMRNHGLPRLRQPSSHRSGALPSRGGGRLRRLAVAKRYGGARGEHRLHGWKTSYF